MGRNCVRRAQVGEVAATAGSISGPSLSISSANPSDLTASNMILNKLTSIQGQLTTMDERVRKNEAALANRTADRAASASESLTPNPASSVAQNFDRSTAENVVPNTDFLQNNDVIQKHVDARLFEYSAMATRHMPGKLKSQRGGQDVPFRRFVGWPQHYVLVGPNKERPSYDSLKPTQWITGVIRAALDLPPAEKDKKFEYIANLMKDASDFSFESARACHAVVLTTMEADRLTWLDTDGLDRARRHHAQRHAPGGGGASFDSNYSAEGKSMLCKFYLDGTCKRHKSHHKNGTFYKHTCQICGASHPNRSCKPKPKS